MKLRDIIDGNKCRLIIFPLYLSLTPFIFVPVIICCFHFFYCILQTSEPRSTVTFYMDIFFVGVNHNFGNISLVLLTNPIYQVPTETATKIYESFPAFPWPLQTTAETVP